MKLLRNILIVFVPIYFIITWWRNKLYDVGILKSEAYKVPVICVGNLSVGGTGKTPMVEYLINLLKSNYKVATLSRGYKRQTHGFIMANENANTETIGDEPFQLYQKFKNIIVSVDANRRRGISKLVQLTNSPDVILLDDAFQHRKVKAGLNILLTAYQNLYSDDLLLPTGDLREPISGADRAHIVVVTKCPESLQESEKQKVAKRLALRTDQHLFFSTIAYSNLMRSGVDAKALTELKEFEFTLVTGIANAGPFVTYLKENQLKFKHLEYPDHHRFSAGEIEMINSHEMILTTEKDYWRLYKKIDAHKLYYLPIEMKFSEGTEVFNGLITEFVTTN